MPTTAPGSLVGLLLSGGLDSSILLGHLLRQGHRVQPFYVRARLRWECEELRSLDAFLFEMACDRLESLVVLDMPLADLYGDHWSINGRGVPDAGTSDDAVYLPGRNAILLVKPAVWCRLHGIGRLALGVLGSNPFGDASSEFFDHYEIALECALGGSVRIVRPFGRSTKREVMELGRDFPLASTFSCIDPVDGLHCGRCNKCAERQEAFESIRMTDPTEYAMSRSNHSLSPSNLREID
jgi:7-cyano-7-deazaguanine synthase